MKNQRKNSEKKVASSNEAKWLTPEEAAKKLGLNYSEENTLQYRLAKKQKKCN